MPLPTTSAVERNLRMLNTKLLERLRAAEAAAAEEKAARAAAEQALRDAEHAVDEARAKADNEELKRKEVEASWDDVQTNKADTRVVEVSYSTIGTDSSTYVDTSKLEVEESPDSERSVSARSEERKSAWDVVVDWWWEVVKVFNDVVKWVKNFGATVFRRRDEQQPLLAANV